jgi:hypothetical protein
MGNTTTEKRKDCSNDNAEFNANDFDELSYQRSTFESKSRIKDSLSMIHQEGSTKMLSPKYKQCESEIFRCGCRAFSIVAQCPPFESLCKIQEEDPDNVPDELTEYSKSNPIIEESHKGKSGGDLCPSPKKLNVHCSSLIEVKGNGCKLQKARYPNEINAFFDLMDHAKATRNQLLNITKIELESNNSTRKSSFVAERETPQTKGPMCQLCGKGSSDSQNSEVVKVRCGHNFHEECVADKERCPICNKILEKDLLQIFD